MIWAIAIRNLFQHRTKTLIIGALVSIGIMMTFFGNALIDSMIRNIEGIFTEYYTGDVLITSTETLGAGVFGAQSDNVNGFPVIPLIRDYPEVLEEASKIKGVRAITHQISAYALINNEQLGMEFSLFFGIEAESYYSAMTGITLVQGRLLEPKEKGIMLEYEMWKKFRDEKELELAIGDTLQLNSFGSAGMKILEVPIVGIFEFPLGNTRLFPLSFIDAVSLRYIMGGQGGTVEKVDVSADATALLDTDLDNLFSDDFSFDFDQDMSSIVRSDTGGAATGIAAKKVTESNVFDILGKTSPPTAVADAEVISNDWHFIVMRLEPGVSSKAVIKELNALFEERDLLARAQGWWVSAMPDSLIYSGVKILFNVAIFILGFVSIIIIMNTLVISVMERTGEIGTMRALGARKAFVTKLFIAETSFITLVFGAIGLAAGSSLILVLNRLGIPTDNDALRYLGGGGILRPTISAQPVILSLSLMAVIALFSWIYPVLIALKVSPLKAISTD
ncbi:MAG TPA: FtsX-like permease family protein [Treponemataceae bacterium]|nr:FtsX-like permease family protein [Treponemataceae bacterium]